MSIIIESKETGHKKEEGNILQSLTLNFETLVDSLYSFLKKLFKEEGKKMSLAASMKMHTFSF